MKRPFDSDDERDPLEDFDLESTEPDVPQPEDPTPSPPEVRTPTGEDTDVDPALKTLFWKLVLLYKASILGVTLGALLVIFGVSPTHGWPLLGGSLVLFGYAFLATKRAKARIDAGEFETSEDDDGVS